MKCGNVLLSFFLVSFLCLLGFDSIRAADRDNNPPGPAGGPGTNWENPPGPKGGPGTSPDHPGMTFNEWLKAHPEEKAKIDLDKNGVIDSYEKKVARRDWRKAHDPNLMYNRWLDRYPEERAKMDLNQDGRIDSMEKKKAYETWWKNHYVGVDRDNNPPGAAGGLGTDWENPPGPRGGPGASPDRRK